MIRSMSARILLISFSLAVFAASAGAQSMFKKINDFDGDGRADFAVTRSEGGLKIWYIWQSTAGFRAVHWGISSDSTVAGDYDGDGRTDLAVSRLSSSVPVTLDYYVLSSQTSSLLFLPVVSVFGPQWFQFAQDQDGDGRTDPGIVISEVRYFVYRSSSSGSTVNNSFDGDGAVRVGDLDGDGNSEIVGVSSSSSTVTIRNPATGVTRTVHFGVFNDRFVPADFDGDGKGDLTIFRPSTGDWWWIRSSDNIVNVVHWGLNGDIPVPADYDGDNKTDLAVYRRVAPNGVYYVNGSQSGFQAFVWGLPTDLPVVY